MNATGKLVVAALLAVGCAGADGPPHGSIEGRDGTPNAPPLAAGGDPIGDGERTDPGDRPGRAGRGDPGDLQGRDGAGGVDRPDDAADGAPDGAGDGVRPDRAGDDGEAVADARWAVGRLFIDDEACTATLLAPDVAVTAAGCVKHRTCVAPECDLDAQLWLGPADDPSVFAVRGVKTLATEALRDVALIRLAHEAPVWMATPQTIGERFPAFGHQVRLIGHGCEDVCGARSADRHEDLHLLGMNREAVCQGDQGAALLDSAGALVGIGGWRRARIGGEAFTDLVAQSGAIARQIAAWADGADFCGAEGCDECEGDCLAEVACQADTCGACAEKQGCAWLRGGCVAGPQGVGVTSLACCTDDADDADDADPVDIVDDGGRAEDGDDGDDGDAPADEPVDGAGGGGGEDGEDGADGADGDDGDDGDDGADGDDAVGDEEPDGPGPAAYPALPAMAIEWTPGPDYTFYADAAPAVVEVEWFVDGWKIGEATRAQDARFAVDYAFAERVISRQVEAVGYSAAGAVVARSYGLLDAVDEPGVYIRMRAGDTYEIGLERPTNDVAMIEVRADGHLLVDGLTGETLSVRLGVRSHFNQLGPRRFDVTLVDFNWMPIRTITRWFTLR